jgi:hypothetical protein
MPLAQVWLAFVVSIIPFSNDDDNEDDDAADDDVAFLFGSVFPCIHDANGLAFVFDSLQRVSRRVRWPSDIARPIEDDDASSS